MGEILTVYEYLANKVKFDVPRKAIISILADRELYKDSAIQDVDKNSLRLAYADILKWFVLGPSKKNNVVDADNGWSHSGGGYDMSDNDRKELKAEANAIYSELEPSSILKSKSTFRVTSHGIKRATRDLGGSPLPHII